MTASHDVDGLRALVERFMMASDAGAVEEIGRTYADDFACLRAPDTGDAVRLSSDVMLSIFASGRLPAMRSISDRIDSIEIIDGLGFALLRRQKDHGKGPETMFYCLVWRFEAGAWRFVREFVSQRTLPGAGRTRGRRLPGGGSVKPQPGGGEPST